VRGLLAVAAAVLLGLLPPVPSLSVPPLALLLACLTVLAPLEYVPFGSLGMPGMSPIGRRGP
jgi:hypothetical protein